jgi:hypothetical protein
MESKRSRHDDVKGLLQRYVRETREDPRNANDALQTLNQYNRIDVVDAAVLCSRIPDLLAALRDEHIRVRGSVRAYDVLENVPWEHLNPSSREDVLVYCLSECVADAIVSHEVLLVNRIQRLLQTIRPRRSGALTARLVELAEQTGGFATMHMYLYVSAERPKMRADMALHGDPVSLVWLMQYQPRSHIVTTYDRRIHGKMHSDLLDAIMNDATIGEIDEVNQLLERNGVPLVARLSYLLFRLRSVGADIPHLVFMIVGMQTPEELCQFIRERFDELAPAPIRCQLLQQTMHSTNNRVYVQRVCARMEIASNLDPIPREELLADGLNADLAAVYYGEHEGLFRMHDGPS